MSHADAHTISIDFHPEWWSVAPVGASAGALQLLLEANWDPHQGYERLSRYCDRHNLENWLDASALRSGGMIAREQLLFPPQPEAWSLVLRETSVRPPAGTAVRVAQEGVPRVASLLRHARHVGDNPRAAEIWKRLLGSPGARFAKECATPFPVPRPPAGPCIMRLPHASLLVRSRTTSLLLDPVGLVSLPSMETAPLDGLKPDAILITHGHGDHWHVPSILASIGELEVPVICPQVPRVNLLTRQDFAHELELCGLSARPVPWGETTVVGDIEIDVLPFYGEQPTRTAPGPHSELRNWGNCYRINTVDFSVMVLVDAGDDPLDSMEAVVSESVRRRGPPTVVSACLREFACPFFGSLEDYWLTLPIERLRELHNQYNQGELPSTTAGPHGLARLCALARSPYFAPYANGYEGWGVPIQDIGWGEGEPSEAEALREFAYATQSAHEGRSATTPLSWNCGDALLVRQGELQRAEQREGFWQN